MKADDYIKMIKDNGLTHTSSREFPLISASCISLGYTKLLKKAVGYSYNTTGSIGKKNQANFLINENKVGESVGKMLKRKNLNSLIQKMKGFFDKNKQLIMRAKKEKDYFKTLEVILNVYPQVFSQTGFYNSIMRYAQNDQHRAKKLGSLAFFVARDKDVAANLIYPVIEPLIKKCVNKIGKTFCFDGDLLRYTTLQELKKFIKEKKISKNNIIGLSKRRKGYLYLFQKGKEYITSDQDVIHGVYKTFINAKKNINILEGTTAYPGKVTGKVYKAFHGVKISKPGYVLVTNITKPADTPHLKKFAGIITNEGGILSHIAVFAREFKIPSIMSTKIATKVLKDGGLVEVDANKAVIKILKRS
ncbi:hypothetical protein COZ26_00910 [Candidatus Kuenenbacteria bacterium CG_4_10_14_3_um_filter_39_14]|uniref:PEP-utilising enzyme mobile domain-containing protein n=4 Tax=Candidatus Kueneniibacteriota TaxID=1752740 RepID=A0A2M7MHP0_9BACT|nr:MAG: hypothetical protein COZ26_00910 [Candidatus Kuenenbacteria bacterium CG_4_10_14_3_um_filter_39_14]